MAVEIEPLEKRLRQAHKEGLIQAEYLGNQIEEAAKAGVIDKAEAAKLSDYHQRVFDLMSVDDFAPEELARAPREAAEAPKPRTVKKAAKKAAAKRKKKVSKKKTAGA